jgi:acetyl-CoA synthetase
MAVEHFEVPEQIKARALLSPEKYQAWYAESVRDPERFWSERAKEFLDWSAPWETTLRWDYHEAKVEWFRGGKLNVAANCVDRHLKSRGSKVAIIWEGNEPGDVRKITYRELHEQVCRAAAMLHRHGVRKGDRVAIYLPMIPEAAVAMLACARLGAIHTVIFAGFSPESIRDRVLDCQCKVVLTANEALRGPKSLPLKTAVDDALKGVSCVEHVFVVARTAHPCPMQAGRDLSWEQEMASSPASFPAEPVDAEDPLFILYTSGSTGKPKGVLHTSGGYLLYAAMTFKYVFDYHEEDIHFCAADVGWVTGHSYIVYGPLANGATTVMFESIPTYPDPGRYWDTATRHRATSFYTAPTAIRALQKEGESWAERYALPDLKVLGSVGEPINEDAWRWYHRVIGKGRCPIVDTWWQTETGGILISPLPGATALKPGSATLPFFGIQPCIVDEAGNDLPGNDVTGRLCLKFPWPGQMRTVYGDHERFKETYFKMYPGKYFTGDACHRDADGYYWLRGRVDDVLLVSGHRIGTSEIESAIVRSGVVAEAAVVGMPHPIKGVGVYAFCIPNLNVVPDKNAEQQVRNAVRTIISPIATPDVVQFVPGLPKTRSGKIMRRILRKIAEGEREGFGDITTLADPAVVEKIVEGADAIPAPK